jgi:hypothetical protein
MPRKSAAAIEAELLVKRPKSRTSSRKRVGNGPITIRQLADDIYASQPPAHWRDGDEYLIEQYAASILACREADENLRRDGYLRKDGKTSNWVVVFEKFSRASVALAARLRLSPQQRQDGKTAAREVHRTKFGNPLNPLIRNNNR